MSTSVYDELLAIDLYDIIYGYITEKDVSIFHGLIQEHDPPGDRLLDLCCGTGAHLRAYQKLGYHVAGVDLSQAMLDRARRTLGAVTLDHGDMKTFQSAEKFDIVTCHSMSILHNTSSADLLKTFSNLFTMLRPSGILIFDALSKDDGAGPPYRADRDPMAQIVIDPDSALFSRYGDEFDLSYDVQWNLAESEDLFLVTFEIEIACQNGTERIVKRMDMGAFSNHQIIDLLREAGFEAGEHASPWSYADLRPDDGRGSIFLVRKPAGACRVGR